MSKAKPNRRAGFLDAYNPAEVYLQRPNIKRGAPGVLEGTSSEGEPLLIRVWPRASKADDSDLIEIWRNELRLLHRLGGAPGAEEHIARLIDAGEDAKGFYIVIAAGQRRPLAVLLERGRGPTAWLRLTAAVANRRRLWANLKRIAIGLEVLHTQGLIHCNLDTWSVLSTGDLEPDFQLTGFEWSMRLMGAGDRGRGKPQAERTVSFLDDWKAFAELAAALLNLDLKRLIDLRVPHYEVAEHLGAEEAYFLRELLVPATHVQLDGDYVARRIDVIADGIESAAAAEEPQYQLVVSLNRDSKLTRAVREASDLTIDAEDFAAQAEFITADLTHARALAIGRTADDYSLVLRGVDLVYRLRAYKPPRSDTPTWEFAVCDTAQTTDEFGAPLLAEESLPTNSVRVMTFGEAHTRTPRLRGRVLSWESVRHRLVAGAPSPQTREQRVLKALKLLHAVDLVSTAAGVFAVRAQLTPSSELGVHQIALTLVPDPDRERLAEALDLRSAESRLKQLLEREIADDEGWRFTEARTLGPRNSGDIDLQFERVEQDQGRTRFLFRSTSSEPTIPETGLLIPGEYRGRISQFHRRAAALRALGSHSELLRMLSDPRGGLAPSHEKIAEDADLQRLDGAKRKAFRELSDVLPAYLVQGPPGVGKTYLVREVVRRRFKEEATARLLLTAQSHHTVDHLMGQISKDWTHDAPLAVRCRPNVESENSGPLDLSSRTQAILEAFSKSPVALASSRHSRLDAVLQPGGGRQVRNETRLVEGLVMRAANVVFATTNSADLERLLEERGQFDWAIIEEAGKATGGELLMPLLLSYRRLMIGDHKQLPPFGSEKLEELLADPETLKPALKQGLPLLSIGLREVLPDDLPELLDAEDNELFVRLCAEARRALFLFESMVETEVQRQERGGRGKPIARKLDIQHRMHPLIGDLVSRCFYDRGLNTSDEARAHFNGVSCPVQTAAPAIVPDTPIVVVDMPYEREIEASRYGERYPRFSNPLEAKAVRAVIANLRGQSVEGAFPSLAVLSPYERQVAKLKADLEDDPKVAAALKTFQPVGRRGTWFSTVDAFQGNEADAVIVSLVRNNHRASPKPALGFVSDSRRMNVLLSRAKWRLYIVTSLEFLRTVVSPLGQEADREAEFLREMLATLDDYFANGSATRVDGAALLETQL